MKAILIIMTTMLFGLSVQARNTRVHTSISVNGNSEEQAIERAQKEIPAIMWGTSKQATRRARENRCNYKRKRNNKHNVNVTGVSVTKHYKLVNEILEAYYRASIRISFRSCHESSRDKVK